MPFGHRFKLSIHTNPQGGTTPAPSCPAYLLRSLWSCSEVLQPPVASVTS